MSFRFCTEIVVILMTQLKRSSSLVFLTVIFELRICTDSVIGEAKCLYFLVCFVVRILWDMRGPVSLPLHAVTKSIEKCFKLSVYVPNKFILRDRMIELC
jgi:hypothetical protein